MQNPHCPHLPLKLPGEIKVFSLWRVFLCQFVIFLSPQLPPWCPCHQKPKRSSCSEYVQTKEAVSIATIEPCGKSLSLTLANLSSSSLLLFLLWTSRLPLHRKGTWWFHCTWGLKWPLLSHFARIEVLLLAKDSERTAELDIHRLLVAGCTNFPLLSYYPLWDNYVPFTFWKSITFGFPVGFSS